MRRELRRHPVQGKPAKTRNARPSRAVAASGPGSGQRSPAPSRGSISPGGLRQLGGPRWARETISELRKVTWPSREEATNLTIVVLVVSAALGLFLGGIDFGFNWVIENTLLR